MNSEMTTLQFVLTFTAIAAILLPQSIFLFTNARKHGHNHWLWGILGLIQAPVPLLIYLFFVRKVHKKIKSSW